MATNTYVALDKVTVGSAVATVTFSSIPSTYTDLKIVADFQYDTSSIYTKLTYNGDNAGTTYSFTYILGDGSAASSGRNANTPEIGIGYLATSTQRGVQTVDILNYSNSTTYKTCLARLGNAGNRTEGDVGLWRNTAAITSISLTASGSAKYIAGSTFSLYGIKAEGQGKATGGYVTSDASYYYHTFTSSGTFTPLQSLSCDYLVVAGGGGGGGNSGGGGGAGGFRTGTSYSTTSGTNYSITIGAGGAGSTGEAFSGVKGSDSVFDTITSTGGGLGAGYVTVGGDGGSGGGGNEVSSTAGGSGNTPSTSPSQGNNGAAGATNRGGGGGGASAAGSGKDGGNGNYTAISGGATTNSGQLSGGNYYFAGGAGAGNYGASGIGGLGGGGTGAAQTGTAQTAGTTNTGGGGGGGGDSARTGRAGGSGIVIVRYAK